MSGGHFILSADNGKDLDALLNASNELSFHINRLKFQRDQVRKTMPPQKREEFSVLPSIAEIEQSHFLPLNESFQPAVSTGAEYAPVTAQGNQNWNSETSFQISLVGDFIGDGVLEANLDAVTASTTNTLPAFPELPGAPAGTITTTPDIGGTLYNSTTYRVHTGGDTFANDVKYTYTYVHEDNVELDRLTSGPHRNHVRYVEYPGTAMFTHYTFNVASTDLDAYGRSSVVSYQNALLPTNKSNSWSRMVGQQVAREARCSDFATAGSSKYVSPDLTTAGGAAVVGAPTSAVGSLTETRTVYDGPQTPLVTQPARKFFMPLQFFFCNIRSAVPSLAIPHGSRYIRARVGDYNDVLQVAPGSVRLRLRTETMTVSPVAAVGGADAAGAEIRGFTVQDTYTPVILADSQLVAPVISSIKLHLLNIFLEEDMHEIYMKRVGLTLIRKYLEQDIVINTTNNNTHLNNIKHAVESLHVTAIPEYNTTRPGYSAASTQVSTGNENFWRDWHRPYRATSRRVDEVSRSSSILGNAAGVILPADISSVAADVSNRQEYVGAVNQYKYDDIVRSLDELGVRSHGTELYRNTDLAFYSDYLPYRRGGYDRSSTEIPGHAVIHWAYSPGKHQPEGYLNFTRARETYLHYVSSYATGLAETLPDGTSDPHTVNIHVTAIVLNFILYAQGNAIVRYQ